MKPNSDLSRIKKKIPERAAAFVNMKTVFARLEKRGQLDMFLKEISQAKTLEEAELLEELSGDQTELESYSQIFKENLKIILDILGIFIYV